MQTVLWGGGIVQAHSTCTELEGVLLKAASETLKAMYTCIILNLVCRQVFLNILLVLKLLYPYSLMPYSI